MNMIFKITNGICLLMLVLLASCLKDDLDNYKPDGVNDLTIQGDLKKTYQVNVGDILKLNAEIGQSQGNGNLTYQWYYYSTAIDTAKRIVVGNTAQLALNIDMPTGPYMLVIETTDTKTGVKAYKKIALTVKRLTSEGWLLLTWKDNKANLSIVTSENDVLKNFLVPSAQYPINAKPEKLYCVNHWDEKIQPIVIQTAQPKLFFLDRSTFEVHNDELSAFFGGNTIVNHFGTDLYFGTYYMWGADGQVYQSDGGEDANYPSGFDQPMQGTYKASRFVMGVESGYPVPSIFYDELSKGFMYEPVGENKLLPFQPKPADAPFSVSNFTDEILYTDLGASAFSYIVGKNLNGEYNLYKLALNKALNIYPAISVDKLDIVNNVGATFFAVSGKLPLLYYIVGNELYVYKMGEKKKVLLYTFPPAETVAAFQMFRETLMLSEADNPMINNRLVVAVNKGTEGVFYTFDLDPAGEIGTGLYSTRNDGFDTIVDIAYKQFLVKK